MDDSDGPRHSIEHEGHDTTPTSRKELMGWYAYAVGAEVFAVCGVGSFLPITLEQLARERGVLWSDKVTPCVQATHATGGGVNSTVALASALLVRAVEKTDNNQCVIHLLGREVNTASFAMYSFSLAVLVQAFTLVSFSSFADYGHNRKTLLLSLGFSGASACMLFVFIFPKIYLLGSVLVIVSITCMGCSWVILNSFLPLLVANDASIRDARIKLSSSSDIALDTFRTEATNADPSELNDLPVERFIDRTTSRLQDPHFEPISLELQLSNKISSKGIGIGYGAAVLVQCLSILLIFSLSKTSISSVSTSLPLRFVLLLIGVWWFGFTMVTRTLIRSRPGPPLKSFSAEYKSRPSLWLALAKFAWASLWKTIKIAAKLRQVIVFLIAWFLLSDAVATVSATAILFAKTELKMATTSVALLSIVSTTSGLVGAFAWPIISNRLRMKSNHTIIACIILFELIPLYGLLAFIPFIKAWGVLGLQQPWEIFPLGCIHGFVAGGLGSYCRSLFGRLIPPGSEAAFYALYAITDKGSSFFGPVLVGVLVDTTGEIRSGFIFLAILIVLPIPLIWAVDAERGRQDGLEMAKVLQSSATSGVSLHQSMSSGPETSEEIEGLLNGTE